MDFDIEGFHNQLTALALALMVSDLQQTARFTGTSQLKEQNPFAKILVADKSAAGETGLGVMGTLGLLASEKYKTKLPSWINPALKTAMILGHGLAVASNASKGFKDNIIVPPIMLTWRWR